MKHPWTSRKLWMTIAANGMMWAAYEMAMRHLYAVPAEKIAAFTALTQTVLYTISAVSAAYVGVTGFIQMKQNSLTRIMAPKYYDDETVS